MWLCGAEPRKTLPDCATEEQERSEGHSDLCSVITGVLGQMRTLADSFLQARTAA